ncbi:hypothetical protein DAETH_29410 [Deinococcus aetherius]|uniref:HEAT repeat domain-containing protein n=1 Tax=Deinococcus aetherius TaxID=200252 RepID=A0ABM8AGP9_9DEIO|nr:HEAT repeat domain-containing protein [Deinococcus aetherius]BDP42972.1 hypothetical protein DAETH_29410 [Deinococcus aetherius]
MLDEKTKARIVHYLSFEPQIGPDLEPWQNEIDEDIEQAAFDFVNTFDDIDVYLFLWDITFNDTKDESTYQHSPNNGRAFRAILNLKSRDPIAFLEEVLSLDDSGWRWVAVKELSERPGVRATQLLIRVLIHDQDSDVRFTAAESLKLIGDESALPALRHAEQHDSGCDYEGFSVAWAAQEAIQAIEARSAVPDPE